MKTVFVMDSRFSLVEGVREVGLLLFVLTIIFLYSAAASDEFFHLPLTLDDPLATPSARFGDSLAVGDVNGDGYDDVIVGTRLSDVWGKDDAGEAFVKTKI